MTGARQDGEACPLDQPGQLLDQRRRRRQVLITDEAEGRPFDRPGGHGEIGVADRGAAAEIALDRRAGQHVAPDPQLGRPGLPIGLRQPALEHRIRHRLDAAPPDGGDPLVPAFRAADPMAGIEQHQCPDEIRPSTPRATGRSSRRWRCRRRWRLSPPAHRAGRRGHRQGRRSRRGRPACRSARGRACRSGRPRSAARAAAACRPRCGRSLPSELTRTTTEAPARPLCRTCRVGPSPMRIALMSLWLIASHSGRPTER